VRPTGFGRPEVRLLGPVELVGPAGPASLTDGAVRTLAAVLALRPGVPVDHEALIEAVWADRAAGRRELPAALSALTHAVDAIGLPGAVRAGPAAAQLCVGPDVVDASRFEAEVARGRARAAAGAADEAAGVLDTALRRWRGSLDVGPLADCPVYGWAGGEVTRLAETRTATMEDRWEFALRPAIEAVRASGGPVVDRAVILAAVAATRTAEAGVAELEAAVAAHPLRERLWELLLTATFLAGRRREALAVHDRASRVFDEQLGVPPGDRLRTLDAAVRRGEIGDIAGPAPDVPRSRPPAQPPPGRAGLPTPLTRLLGRDALVERIVDLLPRHRLATLTGPGGCGKTRVAIAVAARWPGSTALFVDLSAEVDDPAAALAAALGVRDEPDVEPAVVAAGRVCGRDALLLLDNCEHLLAASGRLVRELLARCPGDLTVLCTSRTPLGVPGEAVVAVPPLPLPPPGRRYTLGELARQPATRLFLDRAQARSGRSVPESSAGAVVELCTALDGLPLAIELAAARAPVLTVAEIVSRLRTDLRLLRSPDPTAPARHRTLAGAVESSLGQLDSSARELFRRLSTFAGGFDDAAVRALGGTAEALRALADASLVEPIGSRYRMLSTIHRVARDRLRAADEETAARRAHAAHYLAEAERIDPLLHGPEQERWQAALRTDRANLVAALAWLSGPGAADVRFGDLRLASALATFFHLEGGYREGRAWLSAALDRHPTAPPALRGRAGAGAALLAMLVCDYPAAAERAARARADYRLAGDRRGQARAEMLLGAIARERAEYAQSSAHLDAAAAGYAECGDEWGEARVAQLRGFTAWLAGDLDRAEPRLYACRRRFERLGDAEAAAAAVVHLGAVAHYRGDTDRAAALLDAGLRRYAAMDFAEGVAWAHNLRGLVDLRAGRTGQAGTHLRRSLQLHRQVGDRWRTASVLEALAELARTEGSPTRAAGLLGAAAALRATIGAPVPACERADLEATRDALRAQLGGRRFDAALSLGGEGGLDAVLADRPGVPDPGLGRRDDSAMLA
jgi:predicted ATPase/DNA-binding SARP family transcriptional activator